MHPLTFEQLKRRLTKAPPGSIIIKKLPDGDILVEPQTKQEYLERDYPSLIGQPITLSEAADKYDVPRGTIRDWYYNGYLSKLGDSYPMQVNEAEIAYCVVIYRDRRAAGSKAPLLDEDGLPYEIKRPDLAEYRKRKRNQ